MISEAQLLQQAKQLKEGALIEVYDRYSPGLYRYAMRLLGDENTAEDCVAETFSRFLKAIKLGNGPDIYLQAYLYRIAHNWITDYFRHNPNHLSLETKSLTNEADDPYSAANKHIEEEKIRSYIKLLTADQRQVIVLKYLEDWTNEQIAQSLGKPLGAIKALQHRGLQTLRRLIQGDEAI